MLANLRGQPLKDKSLPATQIHHPRGDGLVFLDIIVHNSFYVKQLWLYIDIIRPDSYAVIGIRALCF